MTNALKAQWTTCNLKNGKRSELFVKNFLVTIALPTSKTLSRIYCIHMNCLNAKFLWRFDHFLMSLLNFYPENLGSMSDEHGQRFHQQIAEIFIEPRYKGKSTTASTCMLADFCWMLQQDAPEVLYKWKNHAKHFSSFCAWHHVVFKMFTYNFCRIYKMMSTRP